LIFLQALYGNILLILIHDLQQIGCGAKTEFMALISVTEGDTEQHINHPSCLKKSGKFGAAGILYAVTFSRANAPH
jgi:hypothetical protein